MTMLKTNDENNTVPKTRKEILSIFSSQKEQMAEFGVQELMLFGSAAKDTLTPQSDVDVVVEFTKTTYRGYLEFKAFLENKLHRDVDLLTLAGVRGRLRQKIEKDFIHVPIA
jgi:predicted nucleotidyltransferase